MDWSKYLYSLKPALSSAIEHGKKFVYMCTTPVYFPGT